MWIFVASFSYVLITLLFGTHSHNGESFILQAEWQTQHEIFHPDFLWDKNSRLFCYIRVSNIENSVTVINAIWKNKTNKKQKTQTYNKNNHQKPQTQPVLQLNKGQWLKRLFVDGALA